MLDERIARGESDLTSLIPQSMDTGTMCMDETPASCRSWPKPGLFSTRIVKRRTRDALVTAVRELLAEGETLQVDEAAERAGISRTTAYRYCPNQRELLLAAHPQISPDTLLDPDAPAEPRARLDVFMAAFTAYNLRWEPQLRTSLRLS
jgi:AcrR family transcriptional regulator